MCACVPVCRSCAEFYARVEAGMIDGKASKCGCAPPEDEGSIEKRCREKAFTPRNYPRVCIPPPLLMRDMAAISAFRVRLQKSHWLSFTHAD